MSAKTASKNQAPVIDLDDLDQAAAQTHRVGVAFDDEGEPTAGFIIVGKDSGQYRGSIKRNSTAALKRGARKATRIDLKTDDGAGAFHDLQQANELETAVAVTVGWFGFGAKGKEAPFSAEAVRAVFAKKPSWRERVSADLEVDSNFLPTSPKSSATSPDTSSD